MKKKIALLIIIACAALFALPALAGCSGTYVEYTLYDAEGNEVAVYELSDDPAADDTEKISAETGSYFAVTGYSGKHDNVVIPATYGGIPVTQIGEYAFEGASVKTVTMSDNITEMGKGAFFYCTSLKTIKLSSNITEIKDSTFGWNYVLASITIPSGVTSVGSWAFYGDSKLESIVFPDSVTYIGAQAFYECEGLSDITFSANLETIDTKAFVSCTSLTKIVLPDSLVTLGYGAFADCEALTDIDMGSGLETVGEYAFYYCLALEEVTVGESVKNIDGYAFYYCTALSTVNMPDTLEYIGAYAFSGCSALKNVNIIESDKTCYLYSCNLASQEETDEKEDGYYAAGGDNAKTYLYTSYNYFGDGLNNHAGYIPYYVISDSEKIADLLKGTLVGVYWYFV